MPVYWRLLKCNVPVLRNHLPDGQGWKAKENWFIQDRPARKKCSTRGKQSIDKATLKIRLQPVVGYYR